MFCAISGHPAQHPVTTAQTGLVYEKALLLKHFEQSATCPITNTPLSPEDLIDLKAPGLTAPRAPSFSSLPTLLSTFQNEWDATMLEMADLRQKYTELRQELSNALYREDAAKRVIARLIKERNQAQEALASIQVAVGSDQPQEMEGVESTNPTSSEFQNVVSETADRLSSQRKKRNIDTPRPEDITSLKLSESFPSLHSSTTPGITCMAVTGSHIVLGGRDKMLTIMDTSGSITATLKGHQKPVTSVDCLLVEEKLIVVSGSVDKQVRLWEQKDEVHKTARIFKEHSSEIVAVCVHPSNKYFISVSKEGKWAVHCLETHKTVHTATDPDVTYTKASVHPDGVILACGTSDGSMRLWDMRSSTVVATFAEPLEGAIQAVTFSENGFHMAVADEKQVSIWSLSKQRCIAHFTRNVKSLAFDHSGVYLVGGGVDLAVWEGGKKGNWAQLVCWEDAADVINMVAWHNSIYATGADRCLRVYA